MWKLLKRANASTVRFCERCDRLCDDACRRAALHERVLLQQVWRSVA